MSERALEVLDLVKVYKPRKVAPVHAVDGLSFTVPRGRIFGLLGPNGAGKTTTLKMLTTLIEPTSGSARVMGFDPARQPLEVRRRISVVIQETAVELFLDARDNLLTFARFHGTPLGQAEQRARRVMELFRLHEEAGKKVMDLSGGYRRRVQVAKVFMVDTPVVFLDEFSTGMDPILKRAVMDLLRQEARQGRTIILTTQVLSEAEELCDDILIINKGRQVARGDLHALKLLSEGVHEVSMTFDALPEGLRADIERLAPVRLEVQNSTVEFALKSEEARVLELVAELARRGRVLRVEISGASLEDIFVELMQK
jgi:ABC-2 type transport system ATP-binding protein